MAFLKDTEPKNVFEFFKKISSIPHGSGNTKGISDYLVSFAKEKNLQAEPGFTVVRRYRV